MPMAPIRFALRASTQFVVGGLVMFALAFAFYIAAVLLQATGALGLFFLTPVGPFVLIALFFFAHAWSMRKSERAVNLDDPVSSSPKG